MKTFLMMPAMAHATHIGWKTETRRLIKQPQHFYNFFNELGMAYDYLKNPSAGFQKPDFSLETLKSHAKFQPGDIVGIKETHYEWGRYVKNLPPAKKGKTFEAWHPGDHNHVEFLINKEDIEPYRSTNLGWHKKPSIFMPDNYIRTFIKINSVSFEPLSDISEEAAAREGIVSRSKDDTRTWKWGIVDSDGMPGIDDFGWSWGEWQKTAKDAYIHLWEQLHGPGSFGIQWVWVYSFEKVEKP